jgi:hypothetical protein
MLNSGPRVTGDSVATSACSPSGSAGRWSNLLTRSRDRAGTRDAAGKRIRSPGSVAQFANSAPPGKLGSFPMWLCRSTLRREFASLPPCHGAGPGGHWPSLARLPAGGWVRARRTGKVGWKQRPSAWPNGMCPLVWSQSNRASSNPGSSGSPRWFGGAEGFWRVKASPSRRTTKRVTQRKGVDSMQTRRGAFRRARGRRGRPSGCFDVHPAPPAEAPGPGACGRWRCTAPATGRFSPASADCRGPALAGCNSAAGEADARRRRPRQPWAHSRGARPAKGVVAWEASFREMGNRGRMFLTIECAAIAWDVA